MLEEHAPNLFTILQTREDWRAIITQPSGEITSLPVLRGNERQCAFWVNQAWLSALSLSMPTTIEEYTEVLRAFRDNDPNGNGKADEIPLHLIGPWESKFLLHAFGLTPNDYHIYLNEEDKVCFAPFDVAFRDYVEWMHMAFSESLLNEDAFHMMHQTYDNLSRLSSADEKTLPTLGSLVSISPYTYVQLEDTTSYAVMPPLIYEGKQVYRKLLNGVGRGAFAVTSACENVPAALRFADMLYTEEGGRLAFAGAEGEDYTFNDEGIWTWNISESIDILAELGKIVIADETRTPGLEPVSFMRSTQVEEENYVRAQLDILRPYLAEAFPITWPTSAEREERIAALQADLSTCIDTAIANFAMGKTVLNDATWQAFEEELYALGAEEFISLWQQKLDEIA